MNDDLPVKALKVSHSSDYELDGSTVKRAVYRFYLGTHGPFTEKFPEDAQQPAAINARIEQLRTEIRGIAT